MEYILYIYKFLLRIRWWVILGTTIITVAVLYATRNMPKTYYCCPMKLFKLK